MLCAFKNVTRDDTIAVSAGLALMTSCSLSDPDRGRGEAQSVSLPNLPGKRWPARVLPHLVVVGDGCVAELSFEIQLKGEVQVTLEEIKVGCFSTFLSSCFFF